CSAPPSKPAEGRSRPGASRPTRCFVPGRGGGAGVEVGGRMLADRIFGAPERRGLPRRGKGGGRAAERRGRVRAGARGRSRGRSSHDVLQRRLALVGLACIGIAVYLGYVLYLGWNGGAVGNGSETALDYAVGAGRVVVPAALGLVGLGLIMRP